MTVKFPTIFTAYTHTPEESVSAASLSYLTQQAIQTQIANISAEIVSMPFNVESSQQYALDLAYKQGQIVALQFLLDNVPTAVSLQHQTS